MSGAGMQESHNSYDFFKTNILKDFGAQLPNLDGPKMEIKTTIDFYDVYISVCSGQILGITLTNDDVQIGIHCKINDLYNEFKKELESLLAKCYHVKVAENTYKVPNKKTLLVVLKTMELFNEQIYICEPGESQFHKINGQLINEIEQNKSIIKRTE
jgi:hypothetical protein